MRNAMHFSFLESLILLVLRRKTNNIKIVQLRKPLVFLILESNIFKRNALKYIKIVQS